MSLSFQEIGVGETRVYCMKTSIKMTLKTVKEINGVQAILVPATKV